MSWIDQPVIGGIIIFNFTFGFIFAVFCLMLFWRKEVREAVLQADEQPRLIEPFMKHPALMFLSVFVLGLPVFLIIVVDMMNQLRKMV